jgi:predicted solute-binding protein
MIQDMDDIKPLKLAPLETPEELASRFEHEKRALNRQRESAMGDSLAPFRVGSVPFLNAAPLVRGIEEQVIYATPTVLAEKLKKNELDAALVSLAEVLLTDRYDILDGIAIASLGEVKSVLLAHADPLEQIKEIYCDPASITSVVLLKILMAERGIKVEYLPLDSGEDGDLPRNFLLIGDRALDFQLSNKNHHIWDLGTAWYEMTSLPFVYAIWAIQRDDRLKPLRVQLREARDFGLDTLDYIIASRTEYSLDFRKDYLEWHIHYHLGEDERRGIARFLELIRKHISPQALEPRFVV